MLFLDCWKLAPPFELPLKVLLFLDHSVNFSHFLGVPFFFFGILRVTTNLGKTVSILLFLDCEHQADTNP